MKEDENKDSGIVLAVQWLFVLLFMAAMASSTVRLFIKMLIESLELM